MLAVVKGSSALVSSRDFTVHGKSALGPWYGFGVSFKHCGSVSPLDFVNQNICEKYPMIGISTPLDPVFHLWVWGPSVQRASD